MMDILIHIYIIGYLFWLATIIWRPQVIVREYGKRPVSAQFMTISMLFVFLLWPILLICALVKLRKEATK